MAAMNHAQRGTRRMQTDAEQVAGLRALQQALYREAGGMRAAIVLPLGDTPALHITMIDATLQVCHATDPGLYDLWAENPYPAQPPLEMMRPGLSLEQITELIARLSRHPKNQAYQRAQREAARGQHASQGA